jgi:hypothetical protein
VHLANGAHNSGDIATVTSLKNREQPVLFRQQLFHPAVVETHPGNAPILANAAIGELIEVHSLVCAMEVSDSDMDDGASQ